MVAELRDLKDQLVEAERAALLKGDSDGESTVLPAGGYVLRVAYERQDRRWDARQKDAWRHGVSLGALVDFSQKYALPLLSGIVLALVLANEARPSYAVWKSTTGLGAPTKLQNSLSRSNRSRFG